MRRTSSGGTSVAPDEMPLSDSIVAPFAFAASSSSNIVVGTPAIVVMPSRSMMSTASPAFQRYVRTILPPAIVKGSRNDCSPPTWNSGNVSSVAIGGAGVGAAGCGRGARGCRVIVKYTPCIRKLREVALRLHRALRSSRRAGRVHDRRVRVEIDRDVGKRRVVARDDVGPRHAVPAGRARNG